MVMGRARRDLRRMRHDQHLALLAQAMEPFADSGRGCAPDAAVDFVENQRRRRRSASQNHLQREHEACELAARGDSRQWPRRRAGQAPVLAVAAALRPAHHRLFAAAVPRLAVMSVTEISTHVQLERIGVVSGASAAIGV